MNSIRHLNLLRYRCLKLVILLPMCLFLYGCFAEDVSDQGHSATEEENDVSTPYVEVISVEKRQISDMPTVSAEIIPSSSMDVIVKTSGTVEEVSFESGARVKKGDVLLKMHSSETSYEKEKAQLSIHRIQNQIVLARDQRQLQLTQAERRISSLTKNTNIVRNNYDDGLATKMELESAVSELEDAKQSLAKIRASNELPGLETQLEQAQIALSQVEEKMAELEVKSPDDGVLTDFMIQPETNLTHGEKIGMVQNLDPIVMKSFITAENVQSLKNKSTLNYVLPETGGSGSGEIRFISDVKDPNLDLYAIELDVRNDQYELKPGMEVEIQLEEEQNLTVVMVPSYSVVTESEETYVFVFKDHMVEKRNVQLGRTSEQYREVVSGLEAGEMLVISNLDGIGDGDQVHLNSDSDSD